MPKPTYKQQAEEIRALKDKISKLEKSVEKQQDGEQIYRALFDHAGFSISLRNPETHEFVVYNKTEYESLGYSRDEFERLTDEEIVLDSPEEKDKHRNLVDEKGFYFFETRQRAKNGGIRDRLMSSAAVTINGELYHLNIASDITEMKRVEKALKSRGQISD